MKKLLAILLGLSVAANVWLLLAQPEAGSPCLPRATGDARSESAEAVAANLTALRGREAPAPETAAFLRAAGLSPEMVRAAVAAQVRERHRAELAATADPSAARTWWRNPVLNSRSDADRERALARAELDHRIACEIADALGEPRPRRERDERYHFLTDEKIDSVRRIERDYAGLLQTAGTFPHVDHAKLALLRAEMKADLGSLLTPTELAEYEVRFSPHAQEVATRIGRIQGTEQEFRTLLQFEEGVRKNLERGSQFPNTPAGDAARQRYHEEAERLLGAERAAEYLWGGENDFEAVRATARAHQTPGAELDYLRVRTSVADRARAIYHDANLNPAEKRAALRNLAGEARTLVDRTIPERLRLAAPPAAFAWIDLLEQGHIRLYTAIPRGFGTYSLPDAPPPR